MSDARVMPGSLLELRKLHGSWRHGLVEEQIDDYEHECRDTENPCEEILAHDISLSFVDDDRREHGVCPAVMSERQGFTADRP
jgi:hypothetical protein